MDYRSVLSGLAQYFEREGQPYAVIGGFGLHAFGIQRATLDLDLATDAAAQEKLIAHLESLGYQTLNVSSGFSNHLHEDPVLGRIDFVYVRGETSRRLFAGCRNLIEFGGRTYPVPRPEHLAAMKVHAMKNDPSRNFREMADIQQILELPGIDETEVKGYFERAGLEEKFNELKRSS